MSPGAKSLLGLILLVFGCAYFNTFYNAQNYYREGKKHVVHDTIKVDLEYFEKTIEKTTMIVVKYPTSRWIDDALFLMGASYYYKGDYKRALEKLDFLCLNYPQSHFYDDARYYQGLAYFKQQKFPQAVIALKDAMESKAFPVKAMIVLCYVYLADHNYANLIDIAQRLLTGSLNAAEKREVYRMLGEAQFNQHLYTEALDTYTKIIALTRIPEEKKNLRLKIARIYLEVGEYELCREFLVGEDDPEFKILLADLKMRLGDRAAAQELYQEIANSGSMIYAGEANFKIAEWYETMDSLEMAISYYEQAVENTYAGDYASRASKKVDVLKRIMNLREDTATPDRAQFFLAEIYFADLDAPEQAVLEYQKVYREFPKSKWAAKAIYAELWIRRNILDEDSLANILADELIKKYPDSPYAAAAKQPANEPRD